jgi:hypothetical protein
VHLDTILGLISEREATARRTADQLREQIATLTSELARIDAELADLVTTRSTLRTLATTEFTADDPTVISSAYQQILAVLGASGTGMRAKDICLALDIEPLPKHVEGARAKLKRMVSKQILTENQPGVKAVGIRVDPGVETRTGPVDFAFSGNQRLRVLLEMKKLNHGESWLGLNSQTVAYLRNQKLRDAVYLAIRNSIDKPMEKRWKELDTQAETIPHNTGLNI